MKRKNKRQRKLRKCELDKKTKSTNKGFCSVFWNGRFLNITNNGFIRSR